MEEAPYFPSSSNTVLNKVITSSTSCHGSFNLEDFPSLPRKNGVSENRAAEDDSMGNNGLRVSQLPNGGNGEEADILGITVGSLGNHRITSVKDLGLGVSNSNTSETTTSGVMGLTKDLVNDNVNFKGKDSIHKDNGGAGKDWRSLFPKPRAVSSIIPMKFTPPEEVNGKIQVAAISEKLSAGIQNCENKVVGFFVGKRLSFAAVQIAVSKMWKFKQEVSIKLYNDVAFIFDFKNAEDRNLVLETGSMYIASKLFTLRPWSFLIENSISVIKSVPVWVLIHGVPLHMWDNEGLGLIASYLGKPLFADDCTLNQERLAYARVCIEIDVDFQYPGSIPLLIDNNISLDLQVDYPWKPISCETCKVFGHSFKNCSKKTKRKWIPKKVCKPPDSLTQKEELSKESIVSEIQEIRGTTQPSPVVGIGGEELRQDSRSAATVGSAAIEKHVGLEVPKETGIPEKSQSYSRSEKKIESGVMEGVEGFTTANIPICESADSDSVSIQGENDGWIEAKGRKCSNKRVSSPKRNPFVMLSDFPYKSKSRFPIDSRKQGKEGFSTPNYRGCNISFVESPIDRAEKKEDSYLKRDRELQRLHWDGNPSMIKDSDSQLGRGCRQRK